MLFKITLRKSLFFFLFDFKQFSLKTNNNESLKKFFQFWKTRYRRTNSISFLFGFSFSLQNGFVHKKAISLLAILFSGKWKVRRKKYFLICARNNFWVARSKNKNKYWTIVVLRRVFKETKMKHAFCFFFTQLFLLSTKFFLKLFFFFVS